MRIPLKRLAGVALFAAAAACSSATGSDAPKYPALDVASLTGTWNLSYNTVGTCPNSTQTYTRKFTAVATFGTPVQSADQSLGKTYDIPIQNASGTGSIGYCDGGATAIVQPNGWARVTLQLNADSAAVRVAISLHGKNAALGEYNFGEVYMDFNTVETAPAAYARQSSTSSTSMTRQ